MSEIDDLRARIERMEDQWAVLRPVIDGARAESAIAVNQAADARHLASGASSDVADAQAKQRAADRLLTALRDTQVEHGKKLDDHGKKLDDHGEKLDDHTIKLDQLRSDMQTGMTQIIGMLNELISRERPQTDG